jgi:poly-gamma-glutamate capsule biosynthesis protein CapA/YwtB (metallophosphatase superfamily)
VPVRSCLLLVSLLGGACFWLGACSRGDSEAPKSPPLQVQTSARAQPAPVAVVVPERVFPDAEPPPEPSIVLAAGGDVNLGRECGQAILRDPGYAPLSGLGPAWKGADARFANLESQLSDQSGETQSPSHRLIFTGPPGGAEVLSLSGIDVVSTANNHAWDYGKSALLETLANLERAGVGHVGTGRDAEEAYRPHVLRVNGLSLALFGVTHVWNQPPFAAHPGRELVAWADVTKLTAGIERARREHDFVVVSYHGGEEYVHAPTERVKGFAGAMLALGVDAVLGHHPHVPQGVGYVDGRPILYSLGNLAFAGHRDRPWTRQSFFARVTLQRGKRPSVSACPFALDGHRPRAFDVGSERVAIELFRRHLIETSLYTGGAVVSGPDALGCLSVAERAPAQASRSSSN